MIKIIFRFFNELPVTMKELLYETKRHNDLTERHNQLMAEFNQDIKTLIQELNYHRKDVPMAGEDTTIKTDSSGESVD